MKTEIRSITPELAKEFLKDNIINRPIRKSLVLAYAEEMKKGNWKLTGEGIMFSEFGNLLDGQHRLLALIEADATLPFLLVYEVRESYFHVINQGLKRSAGDVLATNNIGNPSTKASIIASYLRLTKLAIATLSHQFTGGGYRVDHKISNSDILQFYNDNALIIDEASNESQAHYKRFPLIKKSMYGSYYLYLTLTKKHDPSVVKEFFNQLSTGQNAKVNSIYLFRDKLIKETSSINKFSSVYKSIIFTITWNDFVRGKDRKIFVFNIENHPQII